MYSTPCLLYTCHKYWKSVLTVTNIKSMLATDTSQILEICARYRDNLQILEVCTHTHLNSVLLTNVVGFWSTQFVLREVCVHLVAVKVSVVGLAVGVVQSEGLLPRQHSHLLSTNGRGSSSKLVRQTRSCLHGLMRYVVKPTENGGWALRKCVHSV